MWLRIQYWHSQKLALLFSSLLGRTHYFTQINNDLWVGKGSHIYSSSSYIPRPDHRGSAWLWASLWIPMAVTVHVVFKLSQFNLYSLNFTRVQSKGQKKRTRNIFTNKWCFHSTSASLGKTCSYGPIEDCNEMHLEVSCTFSICLCPLINTAPGQYGKQESSATVIRPLCLVRSHKPAGHCECVCVNCSMQLYCVQPCSYLETPTCMAPRDTVSPQGHAILHSADCH